MRFPSYLQPQMNSRNAAQTRILLWDVITAETRRGSNQTATSNNCFPERKRGGWLGGSFLVPHSGPGVQDAACGSRHAVPL